MFPQWVKLKKTKTLLEDYFKFCTVDIHTDFTKNVNNTSKKEINYRCGLLTLRSKHCTLPKKCNYLDSTLLF